MKRTQRRLALNPETIRALTTKQIEIVAGGASPRTSSARASRCRTACPGPVEVSDEDDQLNGAVGTGGGGCAYMGRFMDITCESNFYVCTDQG